MRTFRIWLAVFALCLAIATIESRPIIAQQPATLRGSVELLEEKQRGPLAGATVYNLGGGSGTTTGHGLFEFSLGQNFHGYLQLRVERGKTLYAVVSPYDGYTPLPANGLPLPMIVVRRGDARAIKNLAVIAGVAERAVQLQSQAPDIFSPQMARRASLERESRLFGVPAESLSKALQTWGRNVEQRYYKGLSLAYEGKQRQALPFLSASMIASESVSVDRYITLASVQRSVGRLRDAQASLTTASAISPQSYRVLTQLGAVLTDRGLLHLADSVLDSAAMLQQSRAPAHSFEFGETLWQLGRLRQKEMRPSEADSLMLKAALIFVGLGDSTAAAALAIRQAPSDDAVEKSIRATIDSLRRIGGSKHREIAHFENTYSKFLAMRGYEDAAIKEQQAAVRISKDSLGADHPVTLAYELGLAQLLAGKASHLQRWSPEQADLDSMLRHLVETGERAGVDDIVVEAIYLQAVLANWDGDTARSNALFAQALSNAQAIFGSDARRVALLRLDYAEVLEQQKRYAEVIDELNLAVAVLDRQPPSAELIQALERLLTVYNRVGNAPEAERIQRRLRQLQQARRP